MLENRFEFAAFHQHIHTPIKHVPQAPPLLGIGKTHVKR